jgi:hypothetical protein
MRRSATSPRSGGLDAYHQALAERAQSLAQRFQLCRVRRVSDAPHFLPVLAGEPIPLLHAARKAFEHWIEDGGRVSVQSELMRRKL